MQNLGPVVPSPLDPQAPLHDSGSETSCRVMDFWRWSASDLLSNATRGVLAEYIVATALDVTDGVRNEWDAYDLTTKSGIAVEVKSAAYLQSWQQKDYSTISFSIAPSVAWDFTKGEWAGESKRQAQVYVFCLLHHRDKATVDPLNLAQWTFYVVSTTALPKTKHLSLKALQRLDPVEARYEGLAVIIEGTANRTTQHK